MRADDRLATLAVIDRVSGILRGELGDRALDIWPILAALLRQHQQGQPVTITALADGSGMPRTSARRVVFALKAQGWLAFRAVSASGKRVVVVPSAALLDRLDRITEQTVKLMVGSRDTAGLDRFAAASLDRDKGIPWPRPAEEGFDDAVVLTLVAYEDPVFDILKRHRSDIERFMGHRVRVLTFPQDAYPVALGRVLAERSTIPAAAPLLVAIPLPWVADVCTKGRLLDLQALLAESPCCGDDFYDAVWRAGWIDGYCYGMPLQPTVEFLWYRQDLFDAEGLTPPRSLDEVIRCAARLHRPRSGRAGISWSSAPGLPLAESFLQMLGAQRGVGVDDGMLHLDADAGTQVIEYLRALRAYAPAQWHDVNWARNAQLFGAGKAAMGYHWSNRYGMLDSHALLQKGGRIGLQLHPTREPGTSPLSPLGGVLLAIPSSSSEAAARSAWRAIEKLTSPELMKYFVLHGAAGSARYSVAEDTYVRQRNHVIAIIDQLARDRQIAAFPAPAISGYQHVTRILSDHLGSLVFDDGGDIRKGFGKLQSALARASRRGR